MNFIVQLHIHTAYTPVNTITLGFAKKKLHGRAVPTYFGTFTVYSSIA